ncbi:L,D-transpeptidase [Rhodococcus tibetensis]|uniref:L,D-transpeptidase n=1 Tax=Rhodococcus tibetensis TaxID=2965064 RepID=A0ABT1QD57_9NOCA|nr:L,D-transpeptidase [Rhodococcus sp. FXJ9.536]MCQ4120137.1 L,D-transpeptidase [Rhodococcus sp. FXJ9.536]
MRKAQQHGARLFLVAFLAALALCGVSGPGSAAPPTVTAAVFAPAIAPASGQVVGVAHPVTIRFPSPVADRASTERAVAISPSKPATGHFSWIDDTELRWAPDGFWPANTAVTVEFAGSKTQFQVGDALVAVANTTTHQFTVSINDRVVQTMPTSMGKPGYETPLGTFPVLEKFRDMVMDSSTYGVPIDSPEGYRLYVEYATRITWGGIFIHGAPWSVASQGHENVSHGCINLSIENARWFYDNAKIGDPVIVTD